MRSSDSAPARLPPKVPALRLGMPVPANRAPRPAAERLIRALARDRLRDLRDDGVTIGYIGRMYGVSGERMQEIERELARPSSRG